MLNNTQNKHSLVFWDINVDRCFIYSWTYAENILWQSKYFKSTFRLQIKYTYFIKRFREIFLLNLMLSWTSNFLRWMFFFQYYWWHFAISLLFFCDLNILLVLFAFSINSPTFLFILIYLYRTIEKNMYRLCYILLFSVFVRIILL